MSSRHGRFQELMARARLGCPRASAALVATCGPRLRRVAHRMLAHKLRGLFDPSDFVQADWLDFFHRHLYKRAFAQLAELIHFLTFVTRGKVIDANRRHLDSETHDRRRERSLQTLPRMERQCVIARDPSAVKMVLAKEELEQALCHLPVHYRRILLMRRAGHSSLAIASAIGLTERTVRRILHFLENACNC
jgi:RNA polymerase sigma factor (sigma-70 family)